MFFFQGKKMKTFFLSIVLLLCISNLLYSQKVDYKSRGVNSYLVNYNAIKCNTFLLNLSQKRFFFLDEAQKCELDYLRKVGSKMTVFYYKDIVATYPSYNEFKIVNLDEEAFLHSGEPSCLNISFKNNNYSFNWLADRRMNISIKGYRLFYSINSDSTAEFSRLDTLVKATSLICSLPKSTKWVKIKTVLEDGSEISFGSPVKLYYSPAEPSIAVGLINEERLNDTLSHKFEFLNVGDIIPDSVIIIVDYNRKNRNDLFVRHKLLNNNQKWHFSKKTYLDPQIRTFGGYEFFLEAFYQNKKIRIPAKGFFTTNINNRMKNDYYGFFIMDVGSKTWREAYIQEVLKSINSLGYSGLFEDDTWYRVSSGSGDCYPPFAYSDSLWYQNLTTFLKEIKASLKNYTVYFNGLYSKNALDLLNYTDGGMTEGFAHTHWSNFINRKYWEELCNVGIKAQNEYKKDWLALGGIINNNPVPRLYVLSSYLLVSGDFSYYANAPNYQTFALYPEFDVPLGAPKNFPDTNINDLKHTYKGNNTDYFLRWFDNGLVAVNPNSDKFVLIEGLNRFLRIDVDNKNTIEGGRLRTIQASDTLYPFQGHIYIEKPTEGKGLFSPSVTDLKIELLELNSDGYYLRLKVYANDSSSKKFMSNPSLPLYIYADLSQLGGPSELVLENDKTPASEKTTEYSKNFLLPYGSISKNDSFYIAVLSTTGLIYVNKFPLSINNPDSMNLVRNFSFEIDSNLDGLPDFWRPYYKGYQYDTSGTNAFFGKKSIYIKNDIDTVLSGAYITIDINQEKPEPIQISGWSKCINVSGSKDNNYSIYADIRYNDDTYLYAQTALFSTGTHDWEYSEKIIEPQKPIKRVYLYALFRRKSGEVWFDHLYMGKPKEPNFVFSEFNSKNIIRSFYDDLNKKILIKWDVDFDNLRIFNFFGKELFLNKKDISIQKDNIIIIAQDFFPGVYLILLNKKSNYYVTKVLIY